MRELREVRRRGFAVDREENEPGSVCYGAAVLNCNALPIAAISVSLPLVRLTPKLDLELAESIMSAAARIGKALGEHKSARDSEIGLSRRGAAGRVRT
jgi:IclR family transcriptional regulator, KDG regulon repressor